MKHRIWKRMALGAMAAMLLWATACTEGQSSGGNAADEGETTVSKATITMEDGQQIHMTLDGEQAPITVENFAKLAKEGDSAVEEVKQGVLKLCERFPLYPEVE